MLALTPSRLLRASFCTNNFPKILSHRNFFLLFLLCLQEAQRSGFLRKVDWIATKSRLEIWRKAKLSRWVRPKKLRSQSPTMIMRRSSREQSQSSRKSRSRQPLPLFLWEWGANACTKRLFYQVICRARYRLQWLWQLQWDLRLERHLYFLWESLKCSLPVKTACWAPEGLKPLQQTWVARCSTSFSEKGVALTA